MNLYAIIPTYAPTNEVQFMLSEGFREALEHAVFVAAHDLVEGYRSPAADVYLIAENVRKVRTAHASDAPAEWQWAHPAVEEALADHVLLEAALDFECGPGSPSA